jgi:hypothetical protein
MESEFSLACTSVSLSVPRAIEAIATNARRYVVIVCALGALLSLITLLVERAQHGDTYVERLIAWGAFWLFTFHAGFGLARSLNPRLVRAIDYVYLATAAFGVLVFALNYGEKRDEYLRNERQARHQIELTEARAETRKAIADLERVSCEQMIRQISPLYCERAKTLAQTLDVDASREKRQAAVLAYSDDVETPPKLDEPWAVTAYRRLQDQVLEFRMAEQGINIAELLYQFNEPLPRREPGEPGEDDKLNLLFSWPFILAFAFALRITKTTIEVFDWTAPAPVPPVIPTNPTVVADPSVFPRGRTSTVGGTRAQLSSANTFPQPPMR